MNITCSVIRRLLIGVLEQVVVLLVCMTRVLGAGPVPASQYIHYELVLFLGGFDCVSSSCCFLSRSKLLMRRTVGKTHVSVSLEQHVAKPQEFLQLLCLGIDSRRPRAAFTLAGFTLFLCCERCNSAPIPRPFATPALPIDY